jgi:hypothetical protein
MDRSLSRLTGMTYHRLLAAMATEPVHLPRTGQTDDARSTEESAVAEHL